MAMNQPGYYAGYPTYQQQPYPYQDQLSQLRSMQYQQNMAQAIPPASPQTAGNGILWVQGEAGAKSYLVAPNTSVLLMDSEGQRFYLKSVDNSGIPTMRTFEYSEVMQKPAQATVQPEHIADRADRYVTREEFTALQSRYNDLQGQCNELIGKIDALLQQKQPAKKKAVTDDA